jgi:hypothetical protein
MTTTRPPTQTSTPPPTPPSLPPRKGYDFNEEQGGPDGSPEGKIRDAFFIELSLHIAVRVVGEPIINKILDLIHTLSHHLSSK